MGVTRLALDTSCVVNLLTLDEEPDAHLVALVKLALGGRVRLSVTPIADAEIAPSSRKYVRDRLEQFPVDEISAERLTERDRLAIELFKTLWPHAATGSRSSDHGLRDCKHLASHILCGGSTFVTLDEDLRRKARSSTKPLVLSVLDPREAVEAVATSSAVATRSGAELTVRRARPDDGGAIRTVLASMAARYSGFENWLERTLTEDDTHASVGIVRDEIAGVAIWKLKDEGVAKLSTFFVGESHRQLGLGSHLLFHQLREWVDLRLRKVIVTVSADVAAAASFFVRAGFRIEGVSHRRYSEHGAELVLAKHLYYERIGDADLGAFAKRIVPEVFSTPALPAVRTDQNWLVPPTMHAPSGRWHSAGNASRLDLCDPSGLALRTLSLAEIEEILHPIRFALSARHCYLVPIRPAWAERMMQMQPDQPALFPPEADRLLLRADNAYYCYPRYGPSKLAGAPVLFYVSQPVSAIVGTARIMECAVAEPAELFLRFAEWGHTG